MSPSATRDTSGTGWWTVGDPFDPLVPIPLPRTLIHAKDQRRFMSRSELDEVCFWLVELGFEPTTVFGVDLGEGSVIVYRWTNLPRTLLWEAVTVPCPLPPPAVGAWARRALGARRA